MSDTKPDGYVYRITNNVNGKTYIGSHAGFNPNYMGSGVALKNAYSKYGPDNFTKEIILHCVEFQKAEEQILMVLDAANDPKMYNLKNTALGGATMTGRSHRESTKLKMSQSATGTNNHQFGKTKSLSVRYKISETMTGVPKPKVQCPHCLKSGGQPQMLRWHFENCKHKSN